MGGYDQIFGWPRKSLPTAQSNALLRLWNGFLRCTWNCISSFDFFVKRARRQFCLARCVGAMAESGKLPVSRRDRMAAALHLAIEAGTASCLPAKDQSVHLSAADISIESSQKTASSRRIKLGALTEVECEIEAL
jgi:hypothetical protein